MTMIDLVSRFIARLKKIFLCFSGLEQHRPDRKLVRKEPETREGFSKASEDHSKLCSTPATLNRTREGFSKASEDDSKVCSTPAMSNNDRHNQKRELLAEEEEPAEDQHINNNLREQPENESVLHVKEALHRYVVGQDRAVKAVTMSILRWRLGLTDPKRPIASFVLLGPPGVGKKQLAKAVAAYLFYNASEALVKIDMSRYREEKHANAWLIGSPGDYAVYEECLADIIRKKPHAVILLQNIDKVHPDVLSAFNRVLDEGRVDDFHGRTVDFRNTMIFMTSHSEELREMDVEITKPRVSLLDWAAAKFGLKFAVRVGDFLSFRPLTQDQILRVTKMKLEKLRKKLGDKKKMKIHFTDAAVEHVGMFEYDEKYDGARSIKSSIETCVVNKLARGMLRGYFKDGDTISVDVAEVVDGDSDDDDDQPPKEKLIFKTNTGEISPN